MKTTKELLKQKLDRIMEELTDAVNCDDLCTERELLRESALVESRLARCCGVDDDI